ncbi:MAG: bacteriocin-associated protein, partial [Candidatus Dormibacteraceae bacterium]
CAYILRVRIAEAIKNRKDTKGVFVLNAAVKSACAVLLIIVGVSLWSQYTDIASKQASLKNWANTRDYGVFYPVSAGNDLIDAQTGQPGPTTAEVFDLYPLLNSMGSLYVDATSYEPVALAESFDPRAFRSITVNPNFLQAFPLRDSTGKPISIPESTSDWVVLAPVSYKSREADILWYFQGLRPSGYEAEQSLFWRTVPDRVLHQQVKIIWTANDQRVFSFDPLVYASDGNVIRDPVIEVITSMNSLGIDRANMITGAGASEALKVRLIGGDSAQTMSVLRPTLKNLKLDDNLQYLVTVNELILQEINQLRDAMKWITVTALILFVGLLVLLAENLAIIFDANARKIVVRRLFGSGFVRTYNEPLRLLAVIWVLQIAAALLANRVGAHIVSVSASGSGSVPDDAIVLSAAAIVVLVELVGAIIALTFIEKRHLVHVLKGVF